VQPHPADPVQARQLVQSVEGVLSAAGPQLCDAAASCAKALLADAWDLWLNETRWAIG
jgi:hypothetical protein